MRKENAKKKKRWELPLSWSNILKCLHDVLNASMRLCLEKPSSITAVLRPACWDPRRPRLSYGHCNLGTAGAQNLWGAGVANEPCFQTGFCLRHTRLKLCWFWDEGWPFPFFLTLQTSGDTVSPPPHLLTSGRDLSFPCGPSLYPTSSSSPPFLTTSVYSHHLLFNCFPSLCSAQQPLDLHITHTAPCGAWPYQASASQLWQIAEALAWIWNLGQAGDFRSHDRAHSLTGLSVGLYDTGFCKSRAIYTLVVISSEIYLRYTS